MKIFTIGFTGYQLEIIRWKYGEGEYLDVTDNCTDVIALVSDMVIIHATDDYFETVSLIKDYLEQAGEEETSEFIFLSESDFMELENKYIDAKQGDNYGFRN